MSYKTIPAQFLYIGAAGEHHVMSECFRNCYEAFKLPIDKGFDLVVTRAYVHFDAGIDSHLPADEAPIYLQVKSRQVRLTVPDNPAERPYWEGCFYIKPAELDLLIRTSNSALACVLFFHNQSEYMQSRTAIAWWMPSEQLAELRSDHFLESKDSENLELWVRYRDLAIASTSRQNEYVGLRKQSGSMNAKPGELANGKLIAPECFDFGKLSAKAR
ncbi:hypothetical protein NM04_06940 [Massilia aurea]|uniref:DUF4365 domain-containing protein n=1 Tax=Massilia aurea TaxID=373040 RepID=A0A422QNB3_9BURK|nr:hypothetical protein [Massilia aurea]RNF31485.1 hypothetical protein NM04_06940 [Massilia aurea]